MKRNINLDLIRCIAVLSVICVHFFLNTGFYDVPILGKRLMLMCGMRTVFMVCVPLFLLLTGYLMCRKELSLEYYKGILHTLSIYCIISVFCILYKYIFQNQKISLFYIIKEILNFSGAPYAWYIEMYIGLFALIPFLNLLYHNLKSKKEKHILLLTLFVLITLPTVCNIFGSKIVPGWWTNMYPIFYFYLGSYLREYRPQLSLLRNSFLLLLTFIISSAFNIYRCSGDIFEWGLYNNWFGIENVCSSVLLFVLINNLNLTKLPFFCTKTIFWISRFSLGMYLSSWIMDQYVYTKLNSLVPDIIYRINYFPVVVFVVAIGSLAISIIADKLSGFLFWVVKVLKRHELVLLKEIYTSFARYVFYPI